MGPLRRGLVAITVAITFGFGLAWPGSASAEPKDPAARKFLERGQAAIDRDDYEDAIASYEKALRIEREPKVLYLLGQAEFLRGRCRDSVRYFKQVKEFEVGAAVKDAMAPYISECAERLAEEPDPTTEPEPTPVEEDDPPVDATEPTEDPSEDEGLAPTRRWYQDPLGDVLVVTGVLSAAAGGSMLVVALRRKDGAQRYDDLEEAASGIRTLRIAGGATLGVGAALMVGGFVRWGLVTRKTKTNATAQVGPLYDGSIAGMSVRGRF